MSTLGVTYTPAVETSPGEVPVDRPDYCFSHLKDDFNHFFEGGLTGKKLLIIGAVLYLVFR